MNKRISRKRLATIFQQTRITLKIKKIKVALKILALFLISNALPAQDHKDIFVFFDATNTRTTLIETPNGTERVKYYRVIDKGVNDSFYIDDTEFSFMKRKFKPKKVSVEKVKQIKFKDISEITQEWAMENNPPLFI